MRSPSGLVSDSMLPPALKRNFRTTSLTSASGDLENQVRSPESRCGPASVLVPPALRITRDETAATLKCVWQKHDVSVSLLSVIDYHL